MSHDWILDVLEDLRGYARSHELPSLAEQLDDAKHVAIAEFARKADAAVPQGPEKGMPKRLRHEGEARGII